MRRGGPDRRVGAGGEARRAGGEAGVAARPRRRARSWEPSCGPGAALGVVVQTGGRTEFGAIATQLGERQPQTAFQLGLRDFSLLLVRVTAVLAGSILVVNVALGRPVLESVLFALAIAVGLTPQLLPAIVTVSLSTGARRLAERKVIVKRLVAIEDLGNIDVLFTDKTGTLTEGRISFAAALDADGQPADEAVLRDGLLCNDAVVDATAGSSAATALDQALWAAPRRARGRRRRRYRRLAARPFDYERRLASVLVEAPDGTRTVIVKGAPEVVLARCRDGPARGAGGARRAVRAPAAASSPSPRATPTGRRRCRPDDEHGPRARRLPHLRRPPEGGRRRRARAPARRSASR